MTVNAVIRYLASKLNARPARLKNLISEKKLHNHPAPQPSVTIIIPTRDKLSLLKRCVESVTEKTTYSNYKILIINNGSVEHQTLQYLRQLEDLRVKTIDYPQAFNYSKICNLGAIESTSEYLCFLNNDTEVIEGDWLTSLIAHAIKPDVGVVGSMLLYPNGSVQHLGVAIGYKGAAGHVFAGMPADDPNLGSAQDECFQVSAVTFACALVSRANYFSVGGLDEKFAVGLNDIDFCLRLQSTGFRNIVCSKSRLYHLESSSRKSVYSFAGAVRAAKEVLRFMRLHGKQKAFADYFFDW